MRSSSGFRRSPGRRRTRSCPPRAGLLVLAAVADVLRDALLERLELLEQLVGPERLLGLGGPEQPRGGLDRGVPRDLVGVGVVLPRGSGLRLGGGLDGVEVDVLEAVA